MLYEDESVVSSSFFQLYQCRPTFPHTEPNARGPHFVRLDLQLAMVHQDLYCMDFPVLAVTLVTDPVDIQILFLNKIDLFAEKLPISPMGDYFPDYTGGANYDAACDYLLHRFVSLNQSAASKQIYAHYTCATDTQQIKCMLRFYFSFRNIPDMSLAIVVLSAIQDILLQIHLRECGLL